MTPNINNESGMFSIFGRTSKHSTTSEEDYGHSGLGDGHQKSAISTAMVFLLREVFHCKVQIELQGLVQ